MMIIYVNLCTIAKSGKFLFLIYYICYGKKVVIKHPTTDLDEFFGLNIVCFYGNKSSEYDCSDSDESYHNMYLNVSLVVKIMCMYAYIGVKSI